MLRCCVRHLKNEIFLTLMIKLTMLLFRRRISNPRLLRQQLLLVTPNTSAARCLAAAASLPVLLPAYKIAALEGAPHASQRGPFIDHSALAKARRPAPSPSTPGKRLLRRFLDAMRVLSRAVKILAYLSPLPALTIASYAIPNKAVDDAAWAYATEAMQRLGPCFVKLAQWAATRRDLFPSSFCDRLSKVREGVLDVCVRRGRAEVHCCYEIW